MNNLTKDVKDFISKYYPHVSLRKNKMSIKKPFEMIIPSEMYPLDNKATLSVFTYANTDRVPETDLKARTAFDKPRFEVGMCYTNTEKMLDSFNQLRISDFTPYFGWILVNGIPIHHCWMVYKKKHVLDPGITKIDELIRMKEYDSEEDMRQDLLTLSKTFKDKPNSSYITFGQAAPFIIYIGTESKPDRGRKTFQELLKKYPEHPSYASMRMNEDMSTDIQNDMRSQ